MTPAQCRAVARRQCLKAVVVGQTLLSLSPSQWPFAGLECVCLLLEHTELGSQCSCALGLLATRDPGGKSHGPSWPGCHPQSHVFGLDVIHGSIGFGAWMREQLR